MRHKATVSSQRHGCERKRDNATAAKRIVDGLIRELGARPVDAGGLEAARILERVRAGTMPCDGAWPAEWVEVFERWTQAGRSA